MKFISEKVRSVTPYTAGEQPRDKKLIKLNTNENPYPPAPEVALALATFDPAKLRLYSDPENLALKKALALRYGKRAEELFIGNGSDEILAMAFAAYFSPGGRGVAYPDVTYSFYPVYAEYNGLISHIVPVKEDFSIALEDYDSIDAEGIILANPNAPTGLKIEAKELSDYITAHPGTLFIADEAYAEFSDCTLIDMAGKLENLLVIRTFSKSYSMAGMRLAFAAGTPDLIAALNIVKNSFNSYTVDAVAEACGVAAVRAETYYKTATEKIKAERAALTEGLRKLGFDVLTSQTNFVFAKAPGNLTAAYVYQEFYKMGILVRYWNKPRISDYVRITVGTHENSASVLAAAKRIAEGKA